MDTALYISVIAVGYLLGSIPTGYLTGKARGVDIRTAGSGNIGATNTFRVLGKTAGIFVLIVDALKGYVSARFVPLLAASLFPETRQTTHAEHLAMAAGAAAVLGHNFTCWLRFKGGKGIATSCGVVLALVPTAAAIVLVTWSVVCWLSGYVSVASIVAAVVLPFATWLTGGSSVMVTVMACLGLLAIIKHRANISRLLAGTETKIGTVKSGGASTVPGGPK